MGGMALCLQSTCLDFGCWLYNSSLLQRHDYLPWAGPDLYLTHSSYPMWYNKNRLNPFGRLVTIHMFWTWSAKK